MQAEKPAYAVIELVSAPITVTSPCGVFVCLFCLFFEVTVQVILRKVLNDLGCHSFLFSEIELCRMPVKRWLHKLI